MTQNNFEIGDQVWWFRGNQMGSRKIILGTVELVHDVITDIQDGLLMCWHSTLLPQNIWGKTRQEAWDRLKQDIEKWGPLDG